MGHYPDGVSLMTLVHWT